jgi:hypothetical protein
MVTILSVFLLDIATVAILMKVDCVRETHSLSWADTAAPTVGGYTRRRMPLLGGLGAVLYGDGDIACGR